jgi:cleavage stimulation factor subunit 3
MVEEYQEQDLGIQEFLSGLDAQGVNGSHSQDHANQSQDSQPVSAYDTILNELRERPLQPDLWSKVIEMAESEKDLPKIEATYEAMLEHYPDTATVQIAYLRHYLSPDLFPTAIAKFNRFLKTNSQSVELWRFYWDCFRKNPRRDPDAVQQINQTYELATNKVGHDKDSGEIWKNYIQFLKERTDWDEQRKRDSLRKVYHKAVQIPLENVESLWQELESFENGISKIIAKKFMADLSPSHMQARSVLRQLQKHIQPLNIPSNPWYPSNPPDLHLPTQPTFSQEDRALVGAWKSYLKWEESNPLELEEKAVLNTRIQGVYRKAMSRMRFYSEIWYMAYTWMKANGKPEDSRKILEDGLKANPKSFLLSFAYSELLELKKEYAAVHTAYTKLLSLLKEDLEDILSQINSPANSQGSIDPNESQATQIVQIDAPSLAHLEAELKERKQEYGLVWIMYIRFSRRAEGVQASRNIFKEARKEKKLTPWSVYEAAAMMEYHNAEQGTQTSKLDIATNIFERGMIVFLSDAEYVQRYLNFLISVNDEKNARALFERVISNFTPDQARPIWERWARYEYQYGDLESSLKLEQRMSEVYPTDPPIKRFAQRHTYPATDAIAARDLGWVKAKSQSGSSSSLSSNSQNGATFASSQGSMSHIHGNSGKRASSPNESGPSSLFRQGGKREGGDHLSGHGPSKRPRAMSPARDRDRDRDRERGGWDHRGRKASPTRRRDPKEEDKSVILPGPLAAFIAEIPPNTSFDGPIFITDDLMSLFLGAVIPASGTASRSKSPQPTKPSRPPPDYGPYQGPGSGVSSGSSSNLGGRQRRF